MSVYLQDIPLPQAVQRLQTALEEAGLWRLLGSEELPLDENLVGRVTAEPVWARLSSPHYHASAMDGFALRAEDIAGAMPTKPITLKVGSQASYVDTGDPLPGWANAVIPIEQIEALDIDEKSTTEIRNPAFIRLRAALPPWSHVRTMGEDMIATQLVLPSGHTLRPVDLGAAAASGSDRLKVARQPLVGILPTGSELVTPGSPLQPGDIIDTNSIVIAAQIKTWGGIPRRYPITADKLHAIRERVLIAAGECDLILLNAGSSAGSEDYSAQVVEELGELLVHGVAVRPGHPVILGMVRRPGGVGEIPLIGVPGYPVSAALTGEIFVEPLLARWLGRQPFNPYEITATLTRKVASPAGDDDYLRVVVGRVGERLLAAPLARGAGLITSLVRADGITIIPRGTQGIEAGSPVKVRLYRHADELERTIFAIGSHDLTLDLLAQFLAGHQRRLVSANVGSLGGLVALRRREAHLAGSHLLDPQTGRYNLSYLREYLPEERVRLIGWVNREQGLMTMPGNPKSIHGLKDLARKDIRFINRQRGAGTRVLLDYHLQQSAIAQDEIQGYDQEEYTHLGVAAAVASGRADCGLGISAAAASLGLDFIPLFHEEYDFVIPLRYIQIELLAPLFELMQNDAFRKAVSSLPGYNVERMGTVIGEN